MLEFTRLKASYGKPWSTKLEAPMTPKLLAKIGECLAKQFAKEALKDFAKRGWSVKDPKGGPDIGDSFSYHVRGNSTVEITSTFYGMDVLINQAIPPHRMTWLTQEAHGTPKELERGTTTPLATATEMVKAAARRKPVEASKRKPLVVPLKTKSGEVIFRMAPLKFADAWIHPGIAKFTFAQRAMRNGKEACLGIISEYIGELLESGKLKLQE